MSTKKQNTKQQLSEFESTPEGGYPPHSLEVLNRLNDTYCTVIDGSHFRVVFRQHDPVLNRDYWVRMHAADFERWYGNRRIDRDVKKLGLSRGAAPTTPLGQAWMEWTKRRGFKSILFDPSGREHPGHLNLWNGFAYQSDTKPEGSWDYMRELIHEVLCAGDDASYQYVLNWLRYLFQHPEAAAEVACVFKGPQGIGKGTLGRTICKLIGRHAMQIASSSLITGRFNAHMQDCIFLFADEAIHPGDREGEGRLKNLITEDMLPIEGKGRDAIQVKNYLHVMMASNEKWVIPASSNDGFVRRFFVSECSPKWQGNLDKFGKLWAELEKDGDAGFSRMLWDLQTESIPERWHPRQLVYTKALAEQKIRSMQPQERWMFNLAHDGLLPPSAVVDTEQHWSRGPVDVFLAPLLEDYNNANRGRKHGDSISFSKEIKQVWPASEFHKRFAPLKDSEFEIVVAPSDGRAPGVVLPSLSDCRTAFDNRLGYQFEWPPLPKRQRTEFD